ncbi:MAG TPA: hypothetical protein VF961_00115, partial [Pyrinomonadaceae bacterium]
MDCAAEGCDGYERVAAAMHRVNAAQAVQVFDNHWLYFDHFSLRVDCDHHPLFRAGAGSGAGCGAGVWVVTGTGSSMVSVKGKSL